MTDRNAFQDLTDAELEQVTGGKKATKPKTPVFANKGKIGMKVKRNFQMDINLDIEMAKEVEWDVEI